MSTAVLKQTKPKLSIKIQSLYVIGAIAAAAAVPQLFHAVGALSGAGTAPGEMFLPMHLPIILVGMLAGPYAGAVAGLLGPVFSFLVSGMPTAAVLPFMMIELCGYGLFAGLMRNTKLPNIGKVIVSQIGGRALRAVAVLIAVYAIGSGTIAVASIWMSIVKGLPGLVIQWILLPLIVFRIDNLKKNES